MSQLTTLVSQLLKYDSGNDWRDASINFLAHLKSSMFEGEVNRVITSVHMPLTKKDLTNLGIAYQSLFQRLVLKEDLLIRSEYKQ